MKAVDAHHHGEELTQCNQGQGIHPEGELDMVSVVSYLDHAEDVDEMIRKGLQGDFIKNTSILCDRGETTTVWKESTAIVFVGTTRTYIHNEESGVKTEYFYLYLRTRGADGTNESVYFSSTGGYFDMKNGRLKEHPSPCECFERG